MVLNMKRPYNPRKAYYREYYLKKLKKPMKPAGHQLMECPCCGLMVHPSLFERKTFDKTDGLSVHIQRGSNVEKNAHLRKDDLGFLCYVVVHDNSKLLAYKSVKFLKWCIRNGIVPEHEIKSLLGSLNFMRVSEISRMSEFPTVREIPRLTEIPRMRSM